MDQISLIEWLTLAVDSLVPIALGLIAFLGRRYVDTLERKRIRYGVGVAWRTETLRELAANLNILTRFHCYVGNWRELSPYDVREAKKRCDELVFGNRFLWSEEFLAEWQNFNDTVFIENRGADSSFLLRANVERYRVLSGWNEEWIDYFVPSEKRIRRANFRNLMDDVLRHAAEDVGVLD